MAVPPLPRPGDGKFFESYTRGLTSRALEQLFTRDTPEAYRFFSRNIDVEANFRPLIAAEDRVQSAVRGSARADMENPPPGRSR